MKYSDHIVIEHPLEKVFSWMFQPQHIVQLVTQDLTKSMSNAPVPSHLAERAAMMQRFAEQAHTEIEIKNLSDSTLHVGTTFQYSTGVRSQSEEFPAWRLVTSGSITIKKYIPSTSFAFAQVGSQGGTSEHLLTFQAQQENTIITYTQLTRAGRIQSILASTLAPSAVSAGEKMIQQQLMLIKAQIDIEID